MNVEIDSPADEADPSSDGMMVAIPKSLHPYVDPAIGRLGYLYPRLVFTSSTEGVRIAGRDLDQIQMRREVLHAVYRERVLSDTLPLRRRLMDGLLG